MRRKLPTSIAMLALGSGLGLGAAQGSAGGAAREGGTFRVVLASLDYIDPALSYSPGGWALLNTTCARLLVYPDKPLPEGSRIVPEVAAGHPRVSKDGKTYTFRLRKGFRFSDGTPVRASAFARAINLRMKRCRSVSAVTAGCARRLRGYPVPPALYTSLQRTVSADRAAIVRWAPPKQASP